MIASNPHSVRTRYLWERLVVRHFAANWRCEARDDTVTTAVVDAMCLYVDDSGTRNPDYSGTLPSHGHDWFGMGGILVRQADENAIRAKHETLCEKWNITYPLHSAEIRSRSKNFKWLGTLASDRFSEFMSDITDLATSCELTAVACVIDRPGYNARYRDKYGRQRWSLCKTAFHIVVERAAKFARERGHPLRVFVEKSDKDTDTRLRRYYDDMRAIGHPFESENASGYTPLSAAEFSATLYEFKTKDKKSPPIQLADICLWPMCIGGYDPMNAPYVALKKSGTLIDCKVAPEDLPIRGIKYSCWELQVRG